MNDDLLRAAEEHFNRGNQFDENGYRDRAIAEWQETVELNPEHAGAHFNLGIAYAEEGNNDRAINALREVIHINPFDTEARRELAEIYLQAGRFEDAVNQLRQTLNIAPNDSAAAHLLAQAYFDRALWDEAAAALEGSTWAEEDAELWFELGQAYERENRLEDAILAYRRALVAQADYAHAIHVLGRLHVPIEEPHAEEE